MPLILGLLLVLGAFFGGQKLSNIDSFKNVAVSTPVPTALPTVPPSTAAPTAKAQLVTTTVDSDPIINCNIHANCGGGTQKMRLSYCKKSVCCQIGSSYKVYGSNEECNKVQGSNYPSCTIYYPSLGYSKTYNYTSPSDCEYWRQRALERSQTLNLPQINAGTLPAVEPYQYSQEYLDSLNNFNNVVNATWAPTQVVLPTPRCYATLEEWCIAHDSCNAPIYGDKYTVTPICD